MNVLTVQCRASSLRCAWSILRPPSKARSFTIGLRRTYATHRDDFDFATRGARVSQALDSKQQSEPKHDSVGPFQLGLSHEALRTGQKLPKWSELDTRGKVLRTTARTTNLGVILLGAGLSALLIWSLTSELFSKNSATVLYGDACELIKNSPEVAKYLNHPLTFHNNPPSANRPRHRNRHVTSQIVFDAYGQEHMVLSFYVKGQLEGSHPHSELSYLEAAQTWIQDKISVLSHLDFDEAVQWAKENAEGLRDKSIQAFKYLSGTPTPPPSLPSVPPPEVEEPKKKESSVWDLVGIFSSLKGTTSKGSSTHPKVIRGATDGSVHADLIRDKDGYFVFRYLLVDIPSSRDPNSLRVFVRRTPGVRENEPVMRWVSSS